MLDPLKPVAKTPKHEKSYPQKLRRNQHKDVGKRDALTKTRAPLSF